MLLCCWLRDRNGIQPVKKLPFMAIYRLGQSSDWYASQHIWCLSQAKINWELGGLRQEGHLA